MASARRWIRRALAALLLLGCAPAPEPPAWTTEGLDADLVALHARIAERPDDAALRAEAGARLLRADRPHAAEQELLAAVARRADDADSHRLLVDVYLARADHVRAFEHLERAKALTPDDPRLAEQEALLLRDAGRPDEAEFVLRGALARSPDVAGLHVAAGLLHLDDGRVEAAIEDLRRAVARAPDHLRAHLLLGQALERAGRPDEASAELVRHGRLLLLHKLGLLGTTPRTSEAERAAALAEHHLTMGAPERAREEAERALASDPGHAGALAVLGRARAELGAVVSAREALERAVDLDPGHVRAGAWLARLLVDAGEPERAVEVARGALKASGWEHADAYVALGLAQRALGERDAARLAFERALALDGAHAEARAALAAGQ